MIRRSAVLIILVSICLLYPSAIAVAAGQCEQRCTLTGHVAAGDAALHVQVGISGVAQTAGDLGKNMSRSGGGTSAGPVIEYAYSPVCDGVCHSAVTQATADSANCSGDAVAVWVSSQVVGSGTGFATYGPPECLTAAEQLSYDPGQLQVMVAEYFRRLPLPVPGLHVAPADNAVVNLPEIVSADAPPSTVFTVAQAPFPVVTIRASVQWLWDFGDGSTLLTDSPGKAYDGTDPAEGGYVTHTYRSANEGWPLSVTSVWTATYTVEGVAGVQTVADAVRRTSTHPLAAAEYGAVLTGN